MGANSREFMKVRMAEEDYQSLPEQYRNFMEIQVIDVEDYDYSEDELWNELKKKSVKAYKDLKKREFDLRHNNKNK